MELKGRIVADDLLAAQWVHARLKRTSAVFGAVILVLVVITMVALFFWQRQSWKDPVTWILPILFAYLMFTVFVLVPRRVRRSYAQRKDLQQDISMTVTSDGLETRTERGYNLKPWDDYLTWKEGKSIFLLYFSDQLYQMIPKRFFSTSDDIDAFREILRNSVK